MNNLGERSELIDQYKKNGRLEVPGEGKHSKARAEEQA
jgi:hypothetical protein